MGALSDAAANATLNAIFRNASYAVAAVYAQLHTGAPGTNGTSNVSSDTSRKVVTFGAASSAVSTSTSDIIWTSLSLSGTETISYVSFWDASSAGNYLGQDDLPVTKTVVSGDAFQINSGDVTCTASGDLSSTLLNNVLDAVFHNNALAIAASYTQLHTGDPGSAGTSNVATSNTRVVNTFGSGAASRSIANTAATTLTLTASETITWMSFWSAVTTGTFVGKKSITSAAGASGDKINMAIGALTAAIT